MKMSPSEEAALREWNKQDPVDAEEFTQNNQIDQLQGNRNPFIDFSDLLERIDHF
jgi:endonuclease I